MKFSVVTSLAGALGPDEAGWFGPYTGKLICIAWKSAKRRRVCYNRHTAIGNSPGIKGCDKG
jgi:hypothetical protein